VCRSLPLNSSRQSLETGSDGVLVPQSGTTVGCGGRNRRIPCFRFVRSEERIGHPVVAVGCTRPMASELYHRMRMGDSPPSSVLRDREHREGLAEIPWEAIGRH
jgi:hypothetical protein